MADHSRALAVARRLIAANGRSIRLQGASVADAVPGKPLHGPAPAPAPVPAIGCFVQPSSLQTLGFGVSNVDMFAGCSQIALVADDGVNNFTNAKKLYDADGTEWVVVTVELLKPGNIAILYYIGVKRP